MRGLFTQVELVAELVAGNANPIASSENEVNRPNNFFILPRISFNQAQLIFKL
jgi:hypothetical protein